MDAREFIEAVVPPGPEGYISIHWKFKGQKRFRGQSCVNITVAMQCLLAICGLINTDIFVCLSRQSQNSGRREANNALALWCVWMDIDVKAGTYANKEEALVALYELCRKLNIPDPSIIIDSGGGLHVYWLSERVLTLAEWKPYATALRNAAQREGFFFDSGITTDAARVLRIPETFNYKLDEPRPVFFLQGTKKRYDLEIEFSSIMGDAEPVLKASSVFTGLDNQDLGAGINYTRKLIQFESVKKNCNFLRVAHDTGGKDFDQTAWRATTLCATFLENGNELAHAFGNQHPEYTHESTEKFWERAVREQEEKNIGWPQCSYISGLSNLCNGCPHLKKGKSPFNLGTYAEQSFEELNAERPEDLKLPDGYAVNKDTGLICAKVRGKTSKGVQTGDRIVNILGMKISSPSLRYHNGHYGINFTAYAGLLNGPKEVYMSITDTGKKFTEFLLDNNITFNKEKDAMPLLEGFGMSWMEKLMREERAIQDSGLMGWRYENGKRTSFVYGSNLYHINGEVVPISSANLDDFRSWYQPTGSRDAWIRAAKLLTDRKRPELDTIISIAFAAPLMAFTGAHYGAILSVWGEPGTSKSTAQMVAAAVWGHPKQTRESLNSTAKSVQGRLGRTRNLPAYWDDIQDERHQEALFQTMFVASQGMEGGRLNTDATMKERLEWQTLLVSCSNASFVEFLTRRQKSTTAGMRRVFEIDYRRNPREPGMIDSMEAARTFAALEHNYGIIGAEYAKKITTEHDTVEKLVVETTNRFKNKVKGAPDESYWWGICGVLLSGAQLARCLGINLDAEAMEDFLVTSFLKNRETRRNEGTEGGSTDNTENMLTSFINTYKGTNSLHVERKFWTSAKTVKTLKWPEHGRPIFMQFNRAERSVSISKRVLKEYLENNSVLNTRQFFSGLQDHFKSYVYKMTLGAGTPFAQTQEACIEIPIPKGSPLEDALLSYGGPDDPVDDTSA